MLGDLILTTFFILAELILKRIIVNPKGGQGMEKNTDCKHKATKKCETQCCYFCFAVVDCSQKCLLDPRACGKEVNIHEPKDK